MTREEIRIQTIAQLERISGMLGSMGEEKDWTEYAIRALEQEPTPKNDCAEQNGCITCSLDDGDDCCRKLYEESMQEPTTKNDLGVDCISRESVLKLIYDYKENHSSDREHYPINYGTLLDMIRWVRKLPSVTPQSGKGHWVDCKCDKCGYVVQPWNTTNFCPNCGDMKEVKE